MNYAGICRFWARWQPDQVAIRFGDDEITWRELDERTDRLAAGFAHLGVGRGDRIGLLMLNRPEFLETCVAAMKLGAMAVPMNVRFTPTEIAFLVADAGCAIVVTDATLAPSLDAALAERPDLPVVLAEDLDSARRPRCSPTGAGTARHGPARCRARCPVPTVCCSPSRWRSPAGCPWR